MSLVGFQKNLVKSAILCDDRDFKRKAISFINNAAFSGEKFQVNDIKETIKLISSDSMVRNIVIDAKMFSDEGLEPALKEIAEAIKDMPVKVFCYLQDHQPPINPKLASQLPMMSFGHLPMNQADFNRTFVIKKDIERALNNEPTPSNSGAAKSGPALSLIEASAHLKETVQLLNQFSQNREQLAALLTVGQRFNGLAGGFSFLVDNPAYASLSQLATVVDEICRHYEKVMGQVEDHHWLLIKEAATCAYLLLREVRDHGSPEKVKELIAKEKDLSQQFTQLTDLHRRQQLDQNMVDSLLDEAQKKSS